MRHVKPPPVRNKIDLADPSQVRGLKKQLHISAGDLQGAVGTVGNSIAAVSKELQKTNPVAEALRTQSTRRSNRNGRGLV
jgi:uncharacterized protein DUF3606